MRNSPPPSLVLILTIWCGFGPPAEAQAPPVQPQVLIEQRALADVGHFYTAEECPGIGARGYRVYETSVAANGEC